MDSAVVLLSGGVASTVAACRRREDTLLHPVYLDYKRACSQSERVAATAVAKALGASLEVLDVPHVAQILAAQQHGADDEAEEAPTSRPPEDVEGSVATMLSIGAEYAAAVGADLVVSGQSALAFDSRAASDSALSQERTVDLREIYHAFSMVMEAALPAVRAVRLEAPFLGLQPSEIVRLGVRLNAPLAATWSCYHNAPPCGTCPGCAARRAAFATAGAPDPLQQHAPAAANRSASSSQGTDYGRPPG